MHCRFSCAPKRRCAPYPADALRKKRSAHPTRAVNIVRENSGMYDSSVSIRFGDTGEEIDGLTSQDGTNDLLGADKSYFVGLRFLRCKKPNPTYLAGLTHEL